MCSLTHWFRAEGLIEARFLSSQQARFEATCPICRLHVQVDCFRIAIRNLARFAVSERNVGGNQRNPMNHFTTSKSPGFQLLSKEASVGPYSLRMAKYPLPDTVASQLAALPAGALAPK